MFKRFCDPSRKAESLFIRIRKRASPEAFAFVRAVAVVDRSMAITILGGARRWRARLQTICWRLLGCQLRFATIDPASVETSETPRKFGEPKPMTPEKPAAVDNDVALAGIEAACDGLKAEVA